MYEPVKSPKILLEYLIEHTYKGLPAELWDRYLWFYEKVVDLLSFPLNGNEHPETMLYADRSGYRISGIACASLYDGKMNIMLDTEDGKSVLRFISALPLANCRNAVLTVNGSKTAETVRAALNLDYAPGLWNYYAVSCTVQPQFKIDELRHGDGYLFRNEKDPDGWKELDHVLDKGIRYFCIKHADRVVSNCGLCRLTAFRSEIIAVWTHDAYRRQGMSKSVCARALAEGLKTAGAVTWTARGSNAASIATAESLGFRPFTKLYCFNLK